MTPDRCRLLYESLLGADWQSRGKRSGDEVRIPCPLPNHADKNPSFDINRSKWTWNCRSEGIGGGAVDLARQMLGEERAAALLRDLSEGVRVPRFGDNSSHKRPIVATFDYCDADGTLLYQVVRYEPKDFRQRRPNGQGAWIWNLDGVSRVLYRLPALMTTTSLVAIAEGERDVDNLVKLGLVATCNVGGAGKWRDEYGKHLRGRDVIILPDNDHAGRLHAGKVASALVGIAKSVRVVALPHLSPKGDVSDWIDAGGTREQLVEIARETPLFETTTAALIEEHASENDPEPDRPPLPFRTAREIAGATSAVIPWIATWWLAAGALTDLVAKIKVGKSTWVAHLVRCLLDGLPFLGAPTTKTKVVWLTEQTDTSFRAALAKANLLDRDDLIVLTYAHVRAVPWGQIVESAVAKAVEIGAAVLVVDTLPQWANLPGDTENDAGAALAAVAPLQVAAADHGLAVLTVRHARKGGGDVGDAGRGSSAIGGAVDIMLLLRAVGSNHPTWRKIHAVSRFDETPSKLTVDLTECGYVVVDETEAKSETIAGKNIEHRQHVLDATPELHDEARSPEEIQQVTGIAPSTVRDVASRLFREGIVSRYRTSGRSPYRYHQGGCATCRAVATTAHDSSTAQPRSRATAAVGGGLSEPHHHVSAVVDPHRCDISTADSSPTPASVAMPLAGELMSSSEALVDAEPARNGHRPDDGKLIL